MSDKTSKNFQARPTHWKDERGYTITDAQREAGGSDWQHFYAVPCRMVGGKVRPLYKCTHCSGTGREPQSQGEDCTVCGRSGGLASLNAVDAGSVSGQQGQGRHGNGCKVETLNLRDTMLSSATGEVAPRNPKGSTR